ncbi:MAG: phosphate ABC transporter substrate-binding/OmpA family protein [Candidatus Melainabacteria bacterium]|nr:phosphate ABC transporter substrate-binding/OmpA family protein [Candidatus Melainabacteria bacterium]
MKNRTVIFAVAILLLGVLGIGIYKVSSNWLLKKKEQEAAVGGSDAKVNRVIRGCGDGYLGYSILNTPEMKRQMARRGQGLAWTDDGGSYEDRLDKFAKGDYDFIVLPVKEYLQHGLKHNYPGVITAAIADSTGADVILGFEDKLPTGTIADLNDASRKFVYVKASPSEFLIDLAVVDFDLFNLTKTDSWRSEQADIAHVIAAAKRREGDFFALWEPDASRLMREVPGLKKVFGSDKFRGYIVDVFVFKRDFVTNNHDDVVAFFEAYYSSMRTFSGDRDKMLEELKVATGINNKTELESVLKTVDWQDLQENCLKQLGFGQGSSEGILNCIGVSTAVLVKTGRLKSDPLADPYRIINTSVLKAVQNRLPAELGNSNVKRQFAQLTEKEWQALPAIGTTQVKNITFQTGSAVLDEAGEKTVDEIADRLANNYPDTRVVVMGHTASGSDESESIKLSKERAEAVVQRLIAVHGMPASRFKVDGKGSMQPPLRRPDENSRAFMYRIPRVEFHLFMDNAF